jgi:hypothetical protein
MTNYSNYGSSYSRHGYGEAPAEGPVPPPPGGRPTDVPPMGRQIMTTPQQGGGGGLTVWWGQQSDSTKVALGVGGAALAAGALYMIFKG